MVKKPLVLALFLLFFSPTPAFAQSSSDSANIPGTTSDTIRQQFLQRREDARTQTSSDRAQLKDQITAQRQAFQERLLQIQDTKKQAVIERIDNKLQLTNETITNRFSDVLDVFSSILDRIDTQKTNAESAGKDTTDLAKAITDARSSIDATKGLVSDQAEQAYLINITTDDALRSAAQDTVSSFRTDIQSLKTEMLSTKDKIKEAARLATSLSNN